MAPTSSPRLSWTRRQESAPAPAERREAARVPQEAAATRARRTSGRLPLPLTSCALGESYTVLAAPSRSTSPPTFSRAGESRRTRSRSSPASCQKPPSLQPGPPSVVLCAQTAALSGAPKYETESHATAMVLSTTDGARQPDVSQGQLIPALTPGIHPEKGYSSKVEKTQSFVIKLKIIVFSLQFQLRKYRMLVTQLYSFMSRLSSRNTHRHWT